MEAAISKTQSIVGFKPELRRFFTLVHMLLSDRMKISFKTNLKGSLLRIGSLILVAVVLTAIGFVFYKVSSMLSLFSSLAFIPEVLPSILSTVVLFISFIAMIFGLVKYLYYSDDNRLMITYPCRGSTVFLARLFVFLLSEYVRTLVVLLPVILAYTFFFSFPWYMDLWLFVAVFLIDMVLVLLASLLSIPGYYISLFLKRNSLIELIASVVAFASVIGVVAWLVSLLPNEVNVFANWSPYFNRIQTGFAYFRTHFAGFYYLTFFEIGYNTGFAYTAFPIESLWVFLVLFGSWVLLFAFAFYVVNPLYLHLASTSFEFDNDAALHSGKEKQRGYFHSQIHKEVLLFVKNPSVFMSVMVTFVALPFIIAIVNKIFKGMDTSMKGNVMVSVLNLLLMMMIALNSNQEIAHLYSQEGKAFFLSRTYPRNASFMLFSKIILPLLLGVFSICLSCYFYGYFNAAKVETVTDAVGNVTYYSWLRDGSVIYMAVGVCSFYIGHALFAAGLDFTSIKSTFTADTGNNKSQTYTTISAYALSFFEAVMFYLFLATDITQAHLKIMLVGLLFLALNIILYIRKVVNVYEEGE